MSQEPNRYVIAYDVQDDRRRSRVAKCLKSYGVRAQFSVYLVDLRPAELAVLFDELSGLMKPALDSIMVCKMGPPSRLESDAFDWIGVAPETPPQGAIII